MTNRQSNIIFYTVISLIIYAVILNYMNPDFFDRFTKSKTELSIKEAIDNGEHKRALILYQQVVDEKISHADTNNIETASMYENMADLYSTLGDKEEEKIHLLKSIKIKEMLKKKDVFSLVTTYDKLGQIAETENKYDLAQDYYEKSLSHKLGDKEEKDEGLFVGMQNTRERYKRLNNELTIATLVKLAEIHRIKQEIHIAKNYYEKALSASKLTFGEDDDRTVEMMKLLNQVKQ